MKRDREVSEDRDDLERLYESVSADLERERGVRAWLRSRPTAVRVVAVLSVAVAAISAPALMMGGIDPSAASRVGWALSVVGLALLVVCAIALSLRPLHREAGPSRAWLAALALAALGSMLAASDGTWGHAASPTCLVLGAMVGLPVLGVGFLVDRAPQRHVAFAAAAASATGMAASQLLCPRRGIAHLLVDHFGALLMLGVGFAALRWALGLIEARIRGARG